MRNGHRQEYEHTTPNGEKVWTTPGENSKDDMKIWTEFPRMPWMTTLYYIGVVLRLKGRVEECNYPNGYGWGMLLAFIAECILTDKSIKNLCIKYKIPLRHPGE